MDLVLVFAVGVLVGWVLNSLWTRATTSWSTARGLMQSPQKVRAEREKQTKKAREDAARGRREFFRALLFFVVIAVVLLVAFMVLGLFAT